MLVISISIFIGYIWPEIMVLKDANEVNLASKKELQDLIVKKDAIELIGKKITDSDGEKIIKEYLPEKKVEERIINEINYLADSSNVSLIDVSLGGDGDAKVKKKATSLGLAGVLNPLARADEPVLEEGSENIVYGGMYATSAKISISAEYDKIKTFMNGLHRTPILNVVKSLEITSKQAEQEEGEASNGNLLVANIVVDFGYMPISKVDNKKVETFEQSGIDKETMDVLSRYISQKAQSLETGNGEMGRTNPFIAN